MLNLISKSNRCFLIISLMIIFSFIYYLYPDSHFSGMNNISETIKNELFKKKLLNEINKNVIENFENYKDLYPNVNNSIQNHVSILETEVKNELESKISVSIEKTRMEKYFDSLYFSIVTGCLLGYGDVYPLTTKCKFTSMIQALLTIIIIVA
jgi:hypothetical protein